MKSTVKFMTLNCWGLPILTPQKNRRLAEIIRIIKEEDWDVVALQEVWLKRDQNKIIKALNFPHSVKFSGDARLLGCGMILLSKYPIIEYGFHAFRVAGFPHRFYEGDYHSTKGVGYALIESPIGKLPVFVTHLIANYSEKIGHDTNRVFRISQVLELALYVRRMATPNGFILCGDLNATSEDLELETLFALFSVGPNQKSKLKSDKKIIDHLFAGATLVKNSYQIQQARLVFRNKFGKENLSYSDHHGISAEIRKKESEPLITNSSRALERALRYLTFSVDVVKQIDRRISYIPIIGHLCHFFMKPQLAFIDALMGILETDIKMSKHQNRPVHLKIS